MVIFGAGTEGKKAYQFIKYLGLSDQVEGFCDNKRDLEKKIIVDGKECYGLEKYRHRNTLFLVAVADEQAKSEIGAQLEKAKQKYYTNIREMLLDGRMDMVEYERKFCAFYHIDQMESYFESAESEESMERFWGKDSVFYGYFSRLDLHRVVELACGRGRHVPKYADRAGEIVLVDILKKNIDYCKERFSGCQNIMFYQNNGYNLEELRDSYYTSLFTYDAMVCFEMMDIYEYLKDIHRILAPGALALFHHSNNHEDYRASFNTELDMRKRSFMSKDLFAYLAYRTGFTIVDQQVMDFADRPRIDCVTLVRK